VPRPGSSFADRLRRRELEWWGHRHPIHRLRERQARRSRDDPEAVWRCCAAWPRTVVDKWNGREFAARHGCRLPELHWAGSSPPDSVIASLPSDYVVRPLAGHSRRGVLVVADGWELIGDQALPREQLRNRLPRSPRLRRPAPMLIEERVRHEDSARRLPNEYKCHAFGETVCAINVVTRHGPGDATNRFFTSDWQAFDDPMAVELPMGPVVEQPSFLAELLERTIPMGRALRTYMRIDFFATERGLVFNEFSSVPGGVDGWTPFCNAYFGALWDEHVASAT
jgi:hypothetical protein